MSDGKAILDAFFGPRDKTEPLTITPLQDAARPVKRRATKKAQNIGQTGERWAAQNLPTITGATLHKAATREITHGEERFWVSQDVDMVGTIPLVGEPRYPVHIEVKATTTALQLSRISRNEARYLDRALKAGEGALVLVVWLPELERPYRLGDVLAADLIPWRRWPDLAAGLRARSSGNFRGRSLRFADRVLIADCALERAGRSWRLCPGHWLAPLVAWSAVAGVAAF
jgi:hypothetical protein